MNKHTPTEIKLQQKSRQMEISFTGASREPGSTPDVPIKSGCH